jgi:EmrB/QacA subfamily drug resistance transporter
MSQPRARASEGAVVATAMLAGVLAPLNSTMIVVALPQILADTGATLTWGTWIVLSYLVAMAAVQPLGGSLGDRFGRRRLLLIGLGTFSLASLAAALAPSVEVLVMARTVQAIAGAIAIPNGTALIRALVEPGRHGAAFGLVGAGIGVAAALGPPVGGIVAEALGWRWIFAANLAVLVPAVVMTLRLPRGEAHGSGRFDVSGAIMLLTTLVAAALAMTVWRVPDAPLALPVALAVAAVAAGASLRAHVARVPAPVIDLQVLARPGFLPAGLSVLFVNLTMYTVLLAVPVFLTRVASWAPRDTGLVLAAMSVLMLVCGPLGGWLSDRVGRRTPALVGALLAAAGTLPLTLIAPSWSWPAYVGALAVIGAGVGLTNAPVQAAALQAVGAGEAGRAAGLFSTMRYAGSILGSAAMAAILADGSTVAPFRTLFAVLVIAAVLAATSASRLPRPTRGSAHEPHTS